MSVHVLVIVAAILAITALSIVALANGIDGVLLSAAFGIIGGLAGYESKILRDKVKK